MFLYTEGEHDIFFTSEALPIPTATSLECWDPNSDGFVPGKTIDPATKQRFLQHKPLIPPFSSYQNMRPSDII
jgi:hypothetical protein